MSDDFLTPKQIAAEMHVGYIKVLRWILAGELAALDVSTKRGGRKRYKVRRADLEAFLSVRNTRPRPVTTRRQSSALPDVPNYY